MPASLLCAADRDLMKSGRHGEWFSGPAGRFQLAFDDARPALLLRLHGANSADALPAIVRDVCALDTTVSIGEFAAQEQELCLSFTLAHDSASPAKLRVAFQTLLEGLPPAPESAPLAPNELFELFALTPKERGIIAFLGVVAGHGFHIVSAHGPIALQFGGFPAAVTTASPSAMFGMHFELAFRGGPAHEAPDLAAALAATDPRWPLLFRRPKLLESAAARNILFAGAAAATRP